MNKDSRKWLYDNLRMNGYNVGNTYEDFSKLMDTNEDSRKWAYDRARELGYNVGKDYSQFTSLIAPEQKQQQAPAQDTTPTPSADTQNDGGAMPTWQQNMAFQIQAEGIKQQAKQSLGDFTTRMENVRKGNALGLNRETKFNPQTGGMEQKYYTTGGEEVNSPYEQSRINLAERDRWEATTEEGRKHREERMQNDYEGALDAALAKFDPDNAALQVWQNAEDRTMAEISKRSAENNYIVGSGLPGRQWSQAVQTTTANMADHLKYHDLQKMADEAWNALGTERQQAITEDIAAAIRNRYPEAPDEQVQQAAKEMARQQSDRRMFMVAVEKNAPQSATEYFFRKAIGGNAVSMLLDAYGRSQAGTTGAMDARELAEQEYDKKGHKAVGIAGTITGFAADPLLWLSAGVGGTALKGSMWLGGKAFGQAATRQFGTTLAGRALGGAIAGSANFGTFEAGGEILDQLKRGSYIDEETGERTEGFSWGNVGDRLKHGMLMGSVTGVIAPFLGNVSDKLVKATESTAGKLAIRTGELGVGTVAEGTIFAASDLAKTAGEFEGAIESLSDENSPNYIADEQEREKKIAELQEKRNDAMMDVWTDNMAMMAGFKLQHMVKSAPARIAEYQRLGKGKAGFETRLRMMLDGTHPELALTDDEKAELENRGYADLKELTEEYNRYKEDKEEYDKARPTTTNASRMIGTDVKDAPLPYNRFIELMNDGSISEAARAKMYYYLTGNVLPMSTVMFASPIEEVKDADGNVKGYTVESNGANGVITRRTFDTKKRAEVEVERINRQAELNGFEIGERFFNRKTDQKRMEQACKNVAKVIFGDKFRFGESATFWRQLYDLIQRKPEEMNEVEREWAEDILEAYDKLGDKYEFENYIYESNGNIFGVETETAYSGARAVKEALKEAYGVDVDKAIAKEGNRRSDKENAALKEYAEYLYKDVKNKQEEAQQQAENPTDPTTPPVNGYIEAMFGEDGGDPEDGMPAAVRRGYDADAQERRDIAIEVTSGNTEAQDAWNGVVQRINDDAAYMTAQQREEDKKKQHTQDGAFHAATLKEKDENGNDRHVYVVDGNVQMTEDGTVNAEKSDNSIVVYEPATGKTWQLDPSADTGLSGLGEVISAEDMDAVVENGRQERVQSLLDEAQGTVRVTPGQQITLPTGEEALVLAADAENVTVQLADGTQASVSRADLQRAADEAALAEYNQRHGVSEEQQPQQPAEEAPQAEEPQQPANVISGAPAEYTEGMEITVLDEDDGTQKPAMVMGRVRYEGGQFVPDPQGNIVEFLMDGEVHHEHIGKMDGRVVGYTLPEQQQPQRTVETPTAENGLTTEAQRNENGGTTAIEQPKVEKPQGWSVIENYIDNNTTGEQLGTLVFNMGDYVPHEEAIKYLNSLGDERSKIALATIDGILKGKGMAGVETYLKQPAQEPQPEPTETQAAKKPHERFVRDKKGNVDWLASNPDDVAEFIADNGENGKKAVANEQKKVREEINKLEKKINKENSGDDLNSLLKANENAGKYQAELDALRQREAFWSDQMQRITDREAQARKEEAERKAAERKAAEQARIELENKMKAQAQAMGADEPQAHNMRATQKGGLVIDGESTVIDAGTASTLDLIGRTLGVEIRIDPKTEGGSNGMWEKAKGKNGLNLIRINPSSKEPLSFIYGHELTHEIKNAIKGDKELWNNFVGIVRKAVGEDRFDATVKKRLQEYNKAIAEMNVKRAKKGLKPYIPLSEADATEEVVCDFVGRDVISDREFAEKLFAEMEKSGESSASIAQRIRDFLRKIYEAFKQIVNPTDEQKRQAEALKAARDMWGDLYELAAAKEREKRADMDEAERQRKEQELQKKKEARQRAIEAYDKPIKDARKRMADDAEAMEVLDEKNREPRDLKEAVAMNIPAHSLILKNWTDANGTLHLGVEGETGFSGKDLNRLSYFIGRRENGAVDITTLAERIYENLPEELKNQAPDGSRDIRNVLIDLLSFAEKADDIIHYIDNARIREAEAIYQSNRDREEAYAQHEAEKGNNTEEAPTYDASQDPFVGGEIEEAFSISRPEKITVKGREYDVKELENDLLDELKDRLKERDDMEIVGVRLVGSYMRGEERPDSDLDLLMEFKGKAKEDDLFNEINDDENRITVNGVTVDVNPITKGKSGTIEEFEKRNEGFTKHEQFKSEEENNGKFDSGNPDIRFSISIKNSDPFYSNAAKATEDIKQGKATGDQWIAMLKKSGGLKAEEDKWMGLTDWLKGKKSVTKEEVQKFIADNAVKIEEEEYAEVGDIYNNPNLKKYNEEYQEIINNYSDEADAEYAKFMQDMQKKYGEDWADEMDERERELEDRLLENRDRGMWDDEGSIREVAYDMMCDRYGDDFRDAFDYEEGVLQPTTDWDDNLTGAAKYFLEFEQKPINSTRLQYTTEGLENKREIALTVPTIEPYNAHDEIHFGDAGEGRAVAWIRFGETTAKDGSKVLVIDEIQSKRHQDGREKGYDTWKETVKEISKKTGISEQTIEDSPYDVANWMDAHAKNEVGRELAQRLRDAYNKHDNSVPDAPFSKTWHELAMKRMLRYAAENGYDKIAWTTGEQQAERYNIGGVIPYIDVKTNPNNADFYRDMRFEANGSGCRVAADKDGKITLAEGIGDAVGKSLAEVFGKDVAMQIMEADREKRILLEGKRIGGEGMKGFYDRMLPMFMDKYGKKWGVKTQDIELDLPNEADRVMHSVDVTPEMKESVMQGQPKFSLSDKDKTLMGVHEISEDKLRKALKLGGLANPSLGVVDTEKRTGTGFGDITLIPKSSLIDKATGRNNGTYLGDAWTATYPNVTKFLSKKGEARKRQIAKEAAGGDEVLADRMERGIQDYIDGNGQHGLYLLFLKQKGIEPEIKRPRTNHSHEEYKEIQKIFGEGTTTMPSNATEEQRKALLDLMMKVYEKKAEAKSSFIEDEEKRKNVFDNLMEVYRQSITDGNGRLAFANGDQFVYDNYRDEGKRNRNEIDWYATENEANNTIARNGLSEEYNKWKESLLGDEDIEEKLFAGFDRDGHRKYVPNTVENASRLMNKASDTNAGDQNGLGATKSALLKRVSTLGEIRKNKGKLQDAETVSEAMKKASDNLFEIIEELAGMQKISDNSFMNIDYAENRLQEALVKRNPVKYLNDEYGYRIDENGEYAQKIKDFIKSVGNLPAKYFETKFKRPVGLDEFAIAVVPEGTGEDVIDGLKRAGLDVRTYDKSDEQSRSNVIMDAVNDRNDIKFSISAARERRLLNDEEKVEAKKKLQSTKPVDAAIGVIKAGEGLTARKAAEKWAAENLKEPLVFDTDAGEVVFDKKSVKTSLAHGYNQAKLDAIPTIGEGMKNAVHLGSLPDWSRPNTTNHFFAYPIKYDGQTRFVFCRAMQDNVKNRLYVHEVFMADKLQKEDNTLQTRDSALPVNQTGGVAFYKNVLSEVLAAKVQENPENSKDDANNFTIGDADSDNLQGGDSKSTIRNTAEQLGEKLHTPLNIIEDVNGITHSNPEVQARRRRSKGWYDKATGQVNVVLANNRDIDDVKATVAHETIAHKGLRELIGKDRYDEFLDETYNHLREDLKKGVDEAAGRSFMDDTAKNGEKAQSYEQHRRTATDELFGRMAEKPFEEFSEGERTLWQRIKDTVRRILDKFLGTLKLPKWFEIGDNELRYMLWRSKERMERGKEDPVDVARDIVKRKELGLDDDALYNAPDKTENAAKSIGERILDNFYQAVSGEIKGKPIAIGRLTKDGKEYLEQLSGVKMKEVVDFVLNPSDMVHIYNDHYGDNEKDKRNNVPLTDDDIRNMAEIISNPESILFGTDSKTGRNMFFFFRKNENGTYNLAEVYGDRRGNLTAKSFYNTKKEATQRVMEIKSSLLPTSVTYSGATPSSDAKIPKLFASAKEEGGKNASALQDLRNVQSGVGKSAGENADLYRDGETDDIWGDMSMGLEERTTAAKIKLSNNHADDKMLRDEAMRAIGGNLSNLHRAMSLQRTFDMTTVKRVADLVRVLMDGGYLSGMSQHEVTRLLAAVKNSVGHNDIERDVQKVMDIMIDNQLRNAEKSLDSLMSIKGSKVDAKGVEVQGKLDPDGAHIMKVFKKAHEWDKTGIEEAIADAQNRIGSDDAAVADEAALEYTGLQLAKEYAENIKTGKIWETKLREEIKKAYEGASERDKATHAYSEYIASLQEAIRQSKLERAESYFNLTGRLTGSLRKSIENAKAFKEAEKQRIHEIQHNANSDMQGRPSDEHYKPAFMDKFVNNSFVSFVFAPLATFDQMLRMFGSKSANGEGYLYNRFMRGWVDARQKEIKGVREKFAVLDRKAAEIFGSKVKDWGDLIRGAGKLPKATVSFWNGGGMQEHELSQGNLMYIYMVNKMLDGRMKLRRMGITEEDVTRIEEAIDPRLIQLADWLQDEFLVGTRNEYNETHKRMFGASMAAVEHYFPLKILANARADKPEDLDNPDRSEGISTATGSIIKRRRNSLALDITGADALSVILDHVAQMEHWNAYAEFNRDLNTLRTYRHFRNQVQNMTTIYGSGKKLWKKFNDVCQMAAGTYRAPRTMLDEAAVNFAKGVTAAKVSFRVFTAMKQILSMPAFFPEARPDYLMANLANPVKAWKWSMENLPIFNERWHSRFAGDPRLLKSDIDWQMWRSRVVQLASRAGMSPNAFIDALTISIGAHSMYQTRLGQYLRDGYDQETAHRKAVQDAEVLYNETQQSSEGAFTSTIQVDRSWLSVLFTVFRNSSMSYTRQLYDALRNLKHNLTPGGYAQSIEFMTKQFVRDGIDEAKAEKNAKRKFGRQMVKDAVRVATFGYIMQLAWNIAPYLSYLLMGDDDDEKKKMWDDIWAHTAFGSLEGLTGGDVMSQAGGMLLTGEGNPAYLSKDMPLTSDVMEMLKKLGSGKHAEAVNDMVNLVVMSGIGVNPQSITDGVLAIMDACGDDPELAHEAAICVMRILQMPQGQADKLYFDEVGLSGDEVSKYTPAQLAERYARYKVKRGRFFAPWSWGDPESIEKFTKKADKTIKERTGRLGDSKVNEAYQRYEEAYKAVDAKMKAANKQAKSTAEGDYIEAARMMSKIEDDPDFITYEYFKDMDGDLDKLAKMYLSSKTAEQAAVCRNAMEGYKAAMVRVLEARSDEERRDAMKNLTEVMRDFSAKYVP